jgi:hypothetical protein
MLAFLTVVLMAGVACAFWRQGLLAAVAMCVNVFLAGLVAFNFWEPLADLLEPRLAGTVLAGYEDGLCLVGLFCLTLGLLRLATYVLVPRPPAYPPALQRGGAVAFGLATGYLVAGFLLCVLQTLPWEEHFLFFDDPADPGTAVRQVLPPDRAWLALMCRAGGDPAPRWLETFESRYARYRRHPPGGEPQPYRGELDGEIERR